MKIFKFPLFALCVTVSTFCCLLIISNPTPKDYEEFAIKELSTYLKQEGCGKLALDQPSLQNPCQSLLKLLIDTSKLELQELITQQTEQKNFLFFSIYQTTLSLSAPFPTYEVETLGIFKNFYIYHAQEIEN